MTTVGKKLSHDPRNMSPSHKAALATGREEARAIKAYLELVEAAGPKRRGRPRTRESIEKRLGAIDTELQTAGVLKRVGLMQETVNLRRELNAMSPQDPGELAAAREGFVRAARAYGERKGIAYETWRAVGVDANVLREAGISRAAGSPTT